MAIDKKKQILFLIDQINYHNSLYYIHSNPEISDQEYDKLYSDLKNLEEQNPDLIFNFSPTQKVGSDIDNTFETVEHSTPMLSLDKAKDQDQLDAFDKRVYKNSNLSEEAKYKIIVQPKFDGVSLSLIYKEGVLVKALTRGNGKEGEDVTLNARVIKNIPLKLLGYSSFNGVIRGEAIMKNSTFEKLNKDLPEGEKYSNPRNTASGALRQKTSIKSADKPLDFIAFELIPSENSQEDFSVTEEKKIEQLRGFGFATPMILTLENYNKDTIFDDINKFNDLVNNTIDYNTDGVVIKINNLSLQKQLGYTNRHPRYSISYKFETEQKVTILKGVDFQVGRTGQVTPVAILNPVIIGGSTVSKATLNNMAYINSLGGLKIGDEVLVEKANEIIPRIVKVIYSDPLNKRVKIPKKCNCGENGDWELNKDRTLHFCTSLSCPSKSLGNLNHAVKKEALDIKGLGPKNMEKLYNAGLVNKYLDLFELKNKKDEFLALEGFGVKTFNNIVSGIEEAINKPFDKVLYSMAIPEIGKTTSKLLIKTFHNIQLFIEAKIEDYIKIEGVGEIMAERIYNWFQKIENIEIIDKMLDLGFSMEAEESIIEENKGVLEGKNILVTGTFKNPSRKELEKLIEDNGGILKKSVSKNVDIFIIGINPGSSKMQKIKALDKDEMSLHEFLAKYKIY